jgi:hypothetical protein
MDGSDPEIARKNVEQAILHSLSLRPRVTLAQRGTLPRFEMKAQRFMQFKAGFQAMSQRT